MNKGIELERLAGCNGYILNEKSNARATTDSDAIDLQGRTHQIGSDKKTVANNYRRILGNDKTAEFQQLMDDDASEMVTLIATYAGKTIFWIFTKENIKRMVDENPEIIYYDRASSKNGGAVTIRVKVKKKFHTVYARYADERVEV